MSDLISRSELLESFRKSYCGHLGMENSDGMLTFRSICRIINEQPTAYNIGKVVEELEEAKHEVCLSDDDLEYYQNGIDEAIEIVKHGDVFDDVCEWKYNDTEYYWESSCDHLHIFMADGPKENEYIFCPYCGKKIKEVK